MKLLALETAGDACSCALLAGEQLLERHRVAPRQHAELLLSMIESLLAEAAVELGHLDALAFGRGPGSFTGVRIAAGVVQGLAFGADLPVVPVSSLQALAQGAWREGGHERVLAAFDARMGEVYWGAYEIGAHGLMVVHSADCLSTPQSVPVPGSDGWFGAGQGWSSHAQALGERMGGRLAACEPHRLARAVDVAVLARAAHAAGESVSAGEALPMYLRNEVARRRGE